jgi:lipoprotein
MKKHLVATLLVAVMCLLTLSACSVVAGLENDVNITLNVNGNALDGNYVVNTFNNAIVPVPEAPKGDVFLGWTADKDWQNKDIADVALSQNKGLIRYDDVKDYAVDGKITLYAVFGVQPRHDIAVAWYDKEKTSGLNQGVMDEFLTALKAFLTTQGYTPDSMDIVVRGYAGNVGPTCGAIMDDGDIDIMVGWAAASNIEGTGGMKRGVDFLQNYGNIKLTGAGKARYTAKLSDSEVVNKVYQWILSTYADEGGATKDYDVADTPVVPDPDPTPTPDPKPTPDTSVDYGKKLTVSIWNNTKGGWITEEQIAKLKTDFEAYLTEKGLDVSTLSITWRVETDVTNVAALVAAVKAAGDVDFVLACGKNVNSDGNLTNLEKLQVAESPYMAANRYIAVLNKDNPRLLAKVLYKFISGQDYPESDTALTITDKELTVSIWNNKKGEWITTEQIDKLKADFESYLTSKGVDLTTITINWKVETDVTNVAALVNSVNNSKKTVDFVLACGKNVNSDGNLTNLEKIKFGSTDYMKDGRFIALLHKDKPNQLATLLWQFMYEQVFVASTQGGAE